MNSDSSIGKHIISYYCHSWKHHSFMPFITLLLPNSGCLLSLCYLHRHLHRDGDKTVSPWHDISLEAGDGLYNLLTEIPKMTKAKMEVATKEASNPIAQDMKKGKLRGKESPCFCFYGSFLGCALWDMEILQSWWKFYELLIITPQCT